jgi:hypothetical protein
MDLPGAALSRSDLEELARSGISTEVAEQAMLRRVDTFDGAQIVGRNGNADYAGIAIPYIWPGDDHVREYRLRRDKPEMEQGKDGRFKERNKYLSPPGRGNMLYLPPGIAAEWLHAASIPVILVEGEKKSLALWGLAWRALGDAAERPVFLPLALPGVWNWRGTVGKTEGPDGGRRDVKGPIPDLDRITWTNRLVTIIFDANVHSDESVQIARKMLATELRQRGALVRFVDIPQEAGVNGVDDLVGTWGPDRVLNHITTTEYDPQKTLAASRVDIDAIGSVRSFSSKGIEFVIDGLIACSAVSVLTGDAGAGKSTFVTSMAGHVAVGETFLGRLCSQRKVLILDRENALPIVDERVARLGIQDGGDLKIWGGWQIEEAPEPGSLVIVDWVTECDPKPLIIVDSLIAFLDGDENNASEVRTFMRQLRQLADLGAAVVLLHHIGKGETSRDYRGSSDIKASADVCYSLTNLGEGQLERLRLKAFKTRFTVERDLILHYIEGRFQSDERPNAVNRTVTEQLYQLLRQNPAIRKTKFEELAAARGLGRDRGRRFLDDGLISGKVRQVKGDKNSNDVPSMRGLQFAGKFLFADEPAN